ncbi:MAG: hypothetical protein WC438_04240 [Candidatus Pacearchaeota archaeon]
MMKKEIVLFMIGICFLLPVLSAGVYFSQLNEVYNLGDTIKTSVEVSPLEFGPLKVQLICAGKSVLAFYGNPSASEEIELPLNYLFLEDIKGGDCYFSADYNKLEYQSRTFKISNVLNIFLDKNNYVVKPGENITVSGTAKRINGVGINGDVEITIPLLSLAENNLVINDTSTNETETNESDIVIESNTGTFHANVVDGVFSRNFDLPSDTAAGNYRIDVNAFEMIDDQKTSEGLAMADLEVLQILKGIDLAINLNNINPGQVFDFKPSLLDQTGTIISDEVSILITNEEQERIYEKIYTSGETAGYDIPTNFSSGYYTIKASSGEFETSKTFFVNEKTMLSFEIVNDTLIVTNIGNIPYKKDFEIELNGKPFVRSLNLDLGEIQKFKLTGDGLYDVIVSDGENEIMQNGVALTGNSVNVKAIGDGSVIFSSPVVWIFLIIVLGAGILFLFRNMLKKKSFAYPFSRKKKIMEIKGNPVVKEAIAKHEEGAIAPRSLVAPKKAEHVLVLTGPKNTVSMVALKVKNELSKESKINLGLIIEKIKGNKGVVYESRDYYFIIFSPLMTRVNKNEAHAAKTAELLEILLKKYNRKFKHRIEFGIAVGSGEIINKIEDQTLKFTPLGSFLVSLKKVAEASKEKVLITKEAHEKSGGEIKGNKISVNGIDAYELKNVVDSEANQKFLQSFMERMNKEDNKNPKFNSHQR